MARDRDGPINEGVSTPARAKWHSTLHCVTGGRIFSARIVNVLHFLHRKSEESIDSKVLYSEPYKASGSFYSAYKG